MRFIASDAEKASTPRSRLEHHSSLPLFWSSSLLCYGSLRLPFISAAVTLNHTLRPSYTSRCSISIFTYSNLPYTNTQHHEPMQNERPRKLQRISQACEYMDLWKSSTICSFTQATCVIDVPFAADPAMKTTNVARIVMTLT